MPVDRQARWPDRRSPTSAASCLQMGKRTGMRVEIIPESSEGDIDMSAAEKLIQELSPVLIAISHVPTNSGDALLSAWLRVCKAKAAECHIQVPAS